MLRKLFLPLTLLAPLFISAAVNDKDSSNLNLTCDTLLKATSARSLSIVSTAKNANITISNINGGAETFYYQTGNAKKRGFIMQTQINCQDISSIVVTETPEKIQIDYVNAEGEKRDYTYQFPDPDNRMVKSYTGTHESDFGITISRKKTTKWEMVSEGFGFGWVTPIKSTPDMNISMWRSNEFTWNIVSGVKMTHRSQSLVMGLGLHWQELTTRCSHHFQKNPGGRLTLEEYADGERDRVSKINFFSLQIPVLYGIRFGHRHNCGFKLGPVVNFNTGAHLTTKYKSGDNHYKITTKGIGQRAVTVDGMAMFNFQAIGLYARYAPMKRFNSRTGLDFGTFSTGIMLGF
ncbi:MAG: hypothetical protein K2G41_09950 [Duncaniella sp.]|uniref:hypothetical protein n=1 Tax=Duncaniella sp. TaxID=2518496 RepID=UPI0023BF3BE2|nr:hypothetical protein [Duncaniella sp.]MDE6091012.1 hypothetical protein [Duncaniella sp.]